MKAWRNEDSVIRNHYERGILQAEFDINKNLHENAKKGNITASQEFKKAQRANYVERIKSKIYFNDED